MPLLDMGLYPRRSNLFFGGARRLLRTRPRAAVGLEWFLNGYDPWQTRFQLVVPLTGGLAEARVLFFQNAAVHHDENTRFACLLRRFLMNDFLLHPDSWNS